MLRIQRFTFNPFSENTYVLHNKEKDCWIVDPGMFRQEEIDALKTFLEAEKLTPRAILNTHAHIDHVLGVAALKDLYQLPFHLHPLELPVLQTAPASALMFGLPAFSVSQPDFALSDGQKMLLGEDGIEIILAPGHSPGSVCFYHADDQWLIGGDVLFEGSVGRTDLPGGNSETLLKSIRTRLYTLPDAVTVWPGHGAETTIGQEKKTNPFVRG